MPRSFHQYPPRVQAAICVMVAAAGATAAWQVVLAPERHDIADRRGRLALLEADTARAAQAAQRLPEVQRDVTRLEAALQQTAAMLPDEKDAQDVLRSLHQLASESNLSINSFTPRPVADHPQYREWPIELGLEGGFHDLSVFFDRVASETRLISVANLHLKVNTNTGSARRGAVAASCIATTFVFGAER